MRPECLQINDSGAGQCLTHAMMIIAQTLFMARTERTALIDTGGEIALGGFADAEILAHDIAIGGNGLAMRRQFFRAEIGKEKIIDQLVASRLQRQDRGRRRPDRASWRPGWPSAGNPSCRTSPPRRNAASLSAGPRHRKPSRDRGSAARRNDLGPAAATAPPDANTYCRKRGAIHRGRAARRSASR